MTDMATDTRVSVHDLDGDERAAFITDHIRRWGIPPLAGGAPEGDDGDSGGSSDELAKAKAEAEKWKALARKHEEASKKNLEKAGKFDQLEESQKTEQQKMADQLAAAKAEADRASAELSRLEVALSKAPAGMPLDRVRKLARRLAGSTPEELEADAAELFADFGPDKDDGNGSDDGGDGGTDDMSGGRGRPTEDLKPGGVPKTRDDDGETNPAKLAAQVPRM